jgi:hypothetical protein
MSVTHREKSQRYIFSTYVYNVATNKYVTTYKFRMRPIMNIVRLPYKGVVTQKHQTDIENCELSHKDAGYLWLAD